jgi:hypothetical protein
MIGTGARTRPKCASLRIYSMDMMPDSVNGSRKVEPKAETPLWRKYVNYGLRELARSWYGVTTNSEAFDENRFLAIFDEAMYQYALENGVDWEAATNRLFFAYLEAHRNRKVITFRSPVENAVWRATTAFLGVVRDAFLNDSAVLEYLDFGLRYFDKLRSGKRPPYPRLAGIGTLDYYETLEVPFLAPEEKPEFPF